MQLLHWRPVPTLLSVMEKSGRKLVIEYKYSNAIKTDACLQVC